MPTEDEVAAGAAVMANLCVSHAIEAPQLPAPCWMGSVRAILEAAEHAREASRRKNCRHPRKSGTGMLSSDGSSHTTWHCPDCGAGGESSTPAHPDIEGFRTMLQNMHP